jgi:2-succinyl-6-hydroxy-2,4-cyclohexadiene-1-carboxylate synthase
VTRVGACQFHLHRWPARAAGAPTLVALHGFTGDGLDYSALRAHLDADLELLAPDLVGHGRSEAPDDLTEYAMGRCVEQICAAVAPLLTGPACWLGYSMGGRTALHVARARPDLVARLVLVSATPGLADPDEAAARRAQDAALAARIERDGVDAFLDAWSRHPLIATQSRTPEPFLTELRARRRRNTTRGLAHSLRGMGTGAMRSLWGELDALTMPTLVITGEEDAKYHGIATRMRDALPDARHAVVPGANHAPQLERPALTAALVSEFVLGR